MFQKTWLLRGKKGYFFCFWFKKYVPETKKEKQNRINTKLNPKFFLGYLILFLKVEEEKENQCLNLIQLNPYTYFSGEYMKFKILWKKEKKKKKHFRSDEFSVVFLDSCMVIGETSKIHFKRHYFTNPSVYYLQQYSKHNSYMKGISEISWTPTGQKSQHLRKITKFTRVRVLYAKALARLT